VISASAVIGGAQFTFSVMPILAAISAIVVFRGRVTRTKEFEQVPLKSDLITNQSDLLGMKRTFMGRASWIEPSILRAIELLVLILAFSYRDTLGVASFVILFAIVFSHYDNLYRALQGEKKPSWLSALGLFVGGRVLMIGIALVAGWDLSIFAWYFSVLFLGIGSIQWALEHRANRINR
jgi:hypothetical protein